MSSPFPDEVEQDLNMAETGRSGCLIPEIEDDSSGDQDYED
jgi:hypothetical protein